MPRRVAVVLTLSTEEQAELELLSRRHTTAQQVAQRARIVLRAAAGKTNAEIGRALGIDVDTVRAWRARWCASQAMSRKDLSLEERLRDRPRSGRKAEIQPDQVCALVALAYEAPAASGRPITQWTGREIAEEVMRRGIVKQISPRHAARLLKRGSKTAPSALLAEPAEGGGLRRHHASPMHSLPGSARACVKGRASREHG